MKAKTYVLPRVVLPRVLAKLDEIANLAVRSAANALVHVIGRYHTAPETFGRHFVLCRIALKDHPEMEGHTEWRIRLAIKAILELGIIYEVDLPQKARFLGSGRFRRPPRLFRLNRHLAKLFPAARSRREQSPSSPEYHSSSNKIMNDRSEASRVYSGGKNIGSTTDIAQKTHVKPSEGLGVLEVTEAAQARHEPNLAIHEPRIVAVEDLTDFDRRLIALNTEVDRAASARLAIPVEPGKLRLVSATEAVVPPEPPPRPMPPTPAPSEPLAPPSDAGDWIDGILDRLGIKLPPRTPVPG